MKPEKEDSAPAPHAASAREKRVGDALRENLRKRKQQQQARLNAAPTTIDNNVDNKD
jgi:hypothetical protein